MICRVGIEVTRDPVVVGRATTGGMPLGSSGRGRLKLYNQPDGDTGYAVSGAATRPVSPASVTISTSGTRRPSLLLKASTGCAGTTNWQHRLVIQDADALQLFFSVGSHMTETHREIYKGWVLLRRHEFIELTATDTADLPWTVAHPADTTPRRVPRLGHHTHRHLR